MTQRRIFLLGLMSGLAANPLATAQTDRAAPSRQAVDTGRPDAAVLRALQFNPVTAPYRIGATWRDGKLVLTGRVGTKQIHDAAVRIALAYTSTVRDDLVIDTAEAHRAAVQAAAGPAYPGVGSPARAMPSLGSMPYALGSLPYVYPQPLFGRLDDPFFGFEPPLLSYPPWWGAVAARDASSTPAPGVAAVPGANAGPATSIPLGPSPGDGTVEMTIDARGVATLRGTVNNLAERIAIGQQIAQTPGVSEVINLLDVKNPGASSRGVSATPPPPPQPALVPAVRPQARGPNAPEARQAVAVDAGSLTPRLTETLARRPALANLPIHVSVHEGTATLTGQVPTVYEAMLAFRAVQQTPGVDQVIDKLQFTVPDGETKNPLIAKGRPEDIEPYLMAQLRRQVGDLAHVDQVRVRADTLEIRGTLARADARPRLDAILRSMPVLRGFRVIPEFTTE